MTELGREIMAIMGRLDNRRGGQNLGLHLGPRYADVKRRAVEIGIERGTWSAGRKKSLVAKQPRKPRVGEADLSRVQVAERSVASERAEEVLKVQEKKSPAQHWTQRRIEHMMDLAGRCA